MQREPLLSMQEELREFVMQTRIRLTTARKLITCTQQTSRKSSIGNGDSLPLDVPPHCETLQDATELSPTSTSTERLDAIKRRLAEQIQKN